MKKILLLGSGELGKEFVISAKRLGQYVIACDSYENAPAMQVADEYEVFSMLDGARLKEVVEKHRPDLIVPEIEAIRTECLYDFERQGIRVVPSAKAVNYTMNRKSIRDLAAKELGFSAGYLGDYFKRVTGVNFTDHLTRVRLKRACKMLADSNSKTYEIAFACGFSNAHYFSVVFKKYTGVLPSEYINTTQGNLRKNG